MHLLLEYADEEAHGSTTTGRKCSGHPPPPHPKQRMRRSKFTYNDVIASRKSAERKGVDSIARAPNRCLATGYGYEMTAAMENTPITVDPSNDVSERRSFHHFRTRASHEIFGYFEADFWNYLLHQMSHSEQAALSSMYEVHELSQQACSSSILQRTKFLRAFVVRQYTKAVGLLSHCLVTGGPLRGSF